MFSQTPVFYPKQATIDLSNPNLAAPKGLDKEAKKKWKEAKSLKKQELKQLDKKFAKRLDSIGEAIDVAQLRKQLSTERRDSSRVKSLLLHGRDNALSNLPSEYANNEFLTMLFDSTYVKNMRANIKDSLLSSQSEQLKGLTQKYGLPDSLSSILQNRDSLNWNSLALNPSLFPSDSAYQDYLSEFDSMNDSLTQQNYLMATESLLNQHLQEQFNSRLMGNMTGLPSGSTDMLASYEDVIQANQYKQMMAGMPGKKQELEQQIKSGDLSMEDIPAFEKHFAGQAKALARAKHEIDVIKKKHTLRDYLKYLFDQDMESFENTSLVKRFSLSGYLQISGQKPVLLDYSPAIAYKATGKMSIGVGVSGRAKLSKGQSDEEDLLAYRSFWEYDFLKKMYLHMEYERTGLMTTNPNTDISRREWSRRWLLGIGRDFKHRSGIKGSLLVLFNFNHSKKGPHGQIIQVRYGLKI